MYSLLLSSRLSFSSRSSLYFDLLIRRTEARQEPTPDALPTAKGLSDASNTLERRVAGELRGAMQPGTRARSGGQADTTHCLAKPQSPWSKLEGSYAVVRATIIYVPLSYKDHVHYCSLRHDQEGPATPCGAPPLSALVSRHAVGSTVVCSFTDAGQYASAVNWAQHLHRAGVGLLVDLMISSARGPSQHANCAPNRGCEAMVPLSITRHSTSRRKAAAGRLYCRYC